jgi:hypothetical protein
VEDLIDEVEAAWPAPPLTAEERTECQAVFEAMDEEQAHRAVRRLIAQDRAARPGPSEFARAGRLPADVARDWSSVLPQPGGAQTPTATDQNSSPEARGLVSVSAIVESSPHPIVKLPHP